MAGRLSQEPASLDDEDWDTVKARDESAVQKLLAFNAESGDKSVSDLFDQNRPLELGEKADDAEDFEDISDDDLPEEEEASGGIGLEGPGLTDDGGTSHDTDDLFGEGRGSSPFDEADGHRGVHIEHPSDSNFTGHAGQDSHLAPVDDLPQFRNINFETELKGEANQDLSIPAPAESAEDLLKQTWPTFEKGQIIDWNDLLPPKKAHYIPKKPLKTPKPLNPTKVSLDLAADQEKPFRIPGPSTLDSRQYLHEAGAKGLVAIVEEVPDEGTGDEDFDWKTPPPEETVGGVTWTDLQVICNDWESMIEISSHFEIPNLVEEPTFDNEEDAEWYREFGVHPSKNQKITLHEVDILNEPMFPTPSFDDFERATSRIAKRPILDLNDPNLLVDILASKPAAKRRRLGSGFTRGGSGTISKNLSQRFNISNDEAYDALKENHQNKVRALIGNISVEHSMPALKLQWPYYRVKLYTKEARSYHRPSLKFNKFLNQPIFFSRPGFQKRKHLKGRSVQDIFKESKDLSLADNSTAMLLEYSEEHPTVLSNFGMGNRIINYYRRKDADDASRPKHEVGETSVLMPEDRSPFAQFGTVDPGETVPTLHNAMYRAPVFKQEPKRTDFLVIRDTTGISGTSWTVRNIDHVYVVGQQLPSIEIPGPNSRKVTNASKNRMKMIAFRKIRHNPNNTVRIDEITSHIAESSDMQNRQKLKEFIKYHKDEKVWRVKPGDSIPDEVTVRSWVKPEDVCVIDAMQVGLRHLEDAGYGLVDQEEVRSDEEQEGDSLEQKLAPWKTTKNFLDASAGKAMLQLHGEGDPSGCGLAFSFIKTSMKGGYLDTLQGPQATSEDAIARERKANGGHKYNVDKQNEIYSKAIREIWEKQKTNLSDSSQRPENDLEDDHTDLEDSFAVAPTPHSATTPAHFDDSASQISRFSTSSRQGPAHRIIRRIKNKAGHFEEVAEIVRDHRVWREYMKRRHTLDADGQNVYETKPTGDPDWDKKEAARVKKELSRLERNKERRHAREKQKGIFRASMEPEGSPSTTPAATTEKPTGTTRKCANCGQMGHIKTNKKLCPMLNGTMKPEDTGPDHGFGAIAAPSFGS